MRWWALVLLFAIVVAQERKQDGGNDVTKVPVAPLQKQDGGNDVTKIPAASLQHQDGGDYVTKVPAAPLQKQDGGGDVTKISAASLQKQDGVNNVTKAPAAPLQKQDGGNDVTRSREPQKREDIGSSDAEVMTSRGSTNGISVKKYEQDVNKPKTNDDDSQAKFFFFASSSTTTKFKLSFITSTTPYTCVSTAAAATCIGRRRRAMALHGMKFDVGTNSKDVHSSLDEADIEEVDDQSRQESPRKFLTVWTTSFSTKTVTSYVTDRGVTVSVSAYCTFAGGSGIPGCAG
ncbi:uncharacterized protein LOC108667343 [Hyalella azteca]|uniref:Uncharacterized protein LOC108667343 n=1 Tax=Hyalella azteca TaxID=294128 RepID=A0A8B7N972_HYAAZ|nr:uncharacterized protein LOC108667343 [Hyalella azteca]XP_018009847.1 uncharacterized protein LOC108667343 [Hyalella azteca]